MKFIAHDYQAYAIERILSQNEIALFLEMGLGKTVITLTAIERILYERFDAKKVLVIAPLRVAEDTWSRESDKWDHTKHLTISKILGSRSERIAAVNRKADIYVINRENVEWLVELYGRYWPFDMVVIDELSSFKSSKSKRFRALRKVRPFIRRMVGLTGTPSPNGLLDLWSQIYLLDMGDRLGKTLTAYRDRYFDPGKRNGHLVYNWKLKDFADGSIYQKLNDLCISMSAADWLTLPDRIDNVITVRLPIETMTIYKKFERDMLLEFASGDITAANAAVLSNKLLQLSNGAIYNENGSVQIVHNEKLEALSDVIESANGKPILVFYAYKHDASRIKERFKTATELKSSADINAWNSKKIPLLLCHPASAGHGLNLQAGGNVIVWFGLTWSLELYQQANARLHRQGQTESVIVHHFVTENTLDVDVMQALMQKEIRQDELLKAVKARLEQYFETSEVN